MPGSIFLRNERVELRTIEDEDFEFLRDNANREEIRHHTSLLKPQNMQMEREFFDEVISSEEDVHLLICRGGASRGMITLREKTEGVGEIGFWISPNHKNQGLALEAAKLLVNYGFNELRLHRIYVEFFKADKATLNVWEDLGFTHEGTLREHVFYNGDFVDAQIMSVLEHEWDN